MRKEHLLHFKTSSHAATLSVSSPVRRSKNGSLAAMPMSATPTKPFAGSTGQLKGVALSRGCGLSGQEGVVGLPLLSEEVVGGGAEMASLDGFGLEAGLGMEVGGAYAVAGCGFTGCVDAAAVDLCRSLQLLKVALCVLLGWTCSVILW